MPRIASPHRSTRAVLISLSSAQFTQLPQECSLVFMIDPPSQTPQWDIASLLGILGHRAVTLLGDAVDLGTGFDENSVVSRRVLAYCEEAP